MSLVPMLLLQNSQCAVCAVRFADSLPARIRLEVVRESINCDFRASIVVSALLKQFLFKWNLYMLINADTQIKYSICFNNRTQNQTYLINGRSYSFLSLLLAQFCIAKIISLIRMITRLFHNIMNINKTNLSSIKRIINICYTLIICYNNPLNLVDKWILID